MENLKIRVANKRETKEVQELFFELGYEKKSVANYYPSWISNFHKCNGRDMKYTSEPADHWIKKCKEITIPELRDLVVLKRNDPKDENVSEENCLYDLYLTESKELYFYHCGKKKWILSSLSGDVDYYCLLNTIEKTMKEYLNKETYAYIKTNDLVSKNGNWIEIPKWAVAYADHKNGHGFFYDSLEKIASFYNIVWSRHTHPEELPFIDDEPYNPNYDGSEQEELDQFSKSNDLREMLNFPAQPLNDQYAEIEKVRQSHRTASEIADSALKHIRERAEAYDQPTGERSAAKTAKAFNAITGKDITESEVWLLLQLLKDVRQWSREDYHQDSAEDCIAYAALKAESLEGKK